jgi:predicted permease
MSGPSSPPRIARGIMLGCAARSLRESVDADTRELYERRVNRTGVWRARMWYRRVAATGAIRFLFDRVRPEATHVHFDNAGKGTMMSTVSWLDFKLGARMLLKYPGLSLISVLALATAIGIGSGAFEYVVEALYPRIPLPEGDRIVQLSNWDSEKAMEEPRSLHDFVIWRQQLKSIEQLGAYREFERNVESPDGNTAPIRIAEVTGSVFTTTRVPPMLGRALTDEDARVNAPAVAVMSYDLWQKRFNGDRSIVGRVIQLGRSNATVVGVMPEGYAFPRNEQLWMPLSIGQTEARKGPPIGIFGRLAKNATIEDAQLELSVIGKRIAVENPATHARLEPEVRMYGRERARDSRKLILGSMGVGVLVILFAACANVATLVFARTAMRESEIVVRNALGATRGRVMSQLFVEALVLALVAAVVGLGGVRAAAAFIEYQTVEVQKVAPAFWQTQGIRFSTIVFATFLAALGAVLIGLLPAIKVTGARVQQGLANIRGGSNLRFGGIWSVIIVFQVAFTVLCLPIGIGVTQEGLHDHEVRAAFASDQYLTFRASLDRDNTLYAADDTTFARRMAGVYDELERRLLQEPNVTAVTFADALPGNTPRMQKLEAQRGREPVYAIDSNRDGYAHASLVDVDIIDAFKIPLVSGRTLNKSDISPTGKRVVINESLAKNIGGNPLGVRVRYAPKGKDGKPGDWFEVVGVVKNLGLEPTDRGETDLIFIPATPSEVDPLSIAVEIHGDPAAFAPRLNRIALEVEPEMKISRMMTLNEVVRRRDLPGLVFMFGAVAIVCLSVILSAAGLFALVSVAVARRTREIGIRVALGASRVGVLRAIFARSAAQIGIGIVLGNILVIGLFSFLSNQLQFDLLIPMLGVSGIMLLVGAAACAVPARRALRVEPKEALIEA